MDLVYISEMEYIPNFTRPEIDRLPHENEHTKIAAGSIGASVAELAAGAVLGRLASTAPVSLLVGAAIAVPAISKLVASEDSKEAVSEESYNEIQKYISKHSLGKQQAINEGFKFPPGHPQVGETYRLHPLASVSPSKQKLYIPEHIFEDVLFEERESELLTLLVNLGATNVEIAKYVDNFLDAEKSGAIEGSVEAVASTSISASTTSESGASEKNVRSFSLKGKPWKYGDKVDVSSYAWLGFEPSWNALITAREIGGCTNATLEIKEASKYMANKEASIQMKAKIYSASGHLKLMEKDMMETTYRVQVEFSDAATT